MLATLFLLLFLLCDHIVLSEEFRQDPKNLMVQNAAHSLDFATLTTNRDVMINDNHVFNTKIPTESMVTNQKSSGRCWIFAALNVFRLEVMKKYNLEEFELSQGYLFFWDKFEKSNCKISLFALCDMSVHVLPVLRRVPCA